MSTSKKPPTLKDVAARAGVSKSLVSLVIHNSPKVSQSSRRLVLAAIDELGYQPNTLARSLAGGASHLLGIVVVCHDDRRWDLTSHAARARANTLDYTPLHMCCDDAESQSRAAEQLLGLRVDALILLGREIDDDALATLTRRVPVAAVGTPTGCGLVDEIATDDVQGADMAVEHLADLGHERIAYLSSSEQVTDDPRTKGYLGAMQARGLESEVIPGRNTERSGADRMASLLAGPWPRPTAVIAAQERAGTGALLSARERTQVPSKVSMVVFDDGARTRPNGLDATVVAAPAADLGTRSVDLVLRRVGSDRQPGTVVLEPALSVGATTGPVPAARVPTGALL